MEQTMFEMVMSYGALGACSVYFAIKDFKLSGEIRNTIASSTEAIREMTTAIKLLEKEIES